LFTMQNTSRQQLTEQFVRLMEQINQCTHSRPLGEWPDLELTIVQIKTLTLLQHQGPQRMGSISTYLGNNLSSSTSIIDRLVDKGLVERVPDPDDRRVVICQLTPRGREVAEQFWRIGRKKVVELAERLDTEELEIVVHAMELLYEATEYPHSSPLLEGE
jgi:DNA-binding MarR family transcriptional regulator